MWKEEFSLGPAYKRDDTDSIETIRYRVMGQSEKNAQALVDAWDKLYNVVQLAGFEHSILGTAFEAAPVGERDRDRARHPAMPSARLRHQPDAAAERADLWVAECRLVEGFGVARLAVEGQCHAERNAVLRQHQIGGLQDVVALDHALRTGDGDRLDIAAEAVRGLQIVHRPDRGVCGGVARIAL